MKMRRRRGRRMDPEQGSFIEREKAKSHFIISPLLFSPFYLLTAILNTDVEFLVLVILFCTGSYICG